MRKLMSAKRRKRILSVKAKMDAKRAAEAEANLDAIVEEAKAKELKLDKLPADALDPKAYPPETEEEAEHKPKEKKKARSTKRKSRSKKKKDNDD